MRPNRELEFLKLFTKLYSLRFVITAMFGAAFSADRRSGKPI